MLFRSRLVRAVAASEAPVICGVGHETDFTLCDFAADLRAPTPTAAAELATRTTILDLVSYLQNVRADLSSLTLSHLNTKKIFSSALIARLRYVSPSRRIQSDRQRLDDLSRRALAALNYRVQLHAAHLKGFASRLEALSPQGVLNRGYAIVTRMVDGSVVTRIKQAKAGEQIRVRVSDGQFDAEITNPKS